MPGVVIIRAACSHAPDYRVTVPAAVTVRCEVSWRAGHLAVRGAGNGCETLVHWVLDSGRAVTDRREPQPSERPQASDWASSLGRCMHG